MIIACKSHKYCVFTLLLRRVQVSSDIAKGSASKNEAGSDDGDEPAPDIEVAKLKLSNEHSRWWAKKAEVIFYVQDHQPEATE